MPLSDYETLGDRINEATEGQHAALEEAVTSYFQKCLYPAASDPGLYAKGLSYFQGIYHRIDGSLRWAEQLHHSLPQNSNPKKVMDNLETGAAPGILYDSRLERGASLTSDLVRIREDFQLSEEGFHQLKPKLAFYDDDIAALKSPLERLEERCFFQFRRHDTELLLAYAWVLYLAIFSGGRYMKASLRASFEDGWLPLLKARDDTQKERSPDDYLRFWSFGDTDIEAEEIRETFKTRFSQAAEYSSQAERKSIETNIVSEAVRIMESLAVIIQEVADAVENPKPHVPTG